MKPVIYRLRQLPETVSTNEDAKQAAAYGEPGGLVVQAARQTGGKGRQGRQWESPEGNMYASVVLRPECSAQEIGCYAFVAALAAHGAVLSFLPKDCSVEVKWPNDILVDERKICGILLEASPLSTEGKVDWLVVGCGINIMHHPVGGLYETTSMAEYGSTPDVDNVLRVFLQRLEYWRLKLVNEGFDPVRTAWMERAYKGRVQVRLPNETIVGTLAGIDDAGYLVVHLDDATERRIAAGDVFLG